MDNKFTPTFGRTPLYLAGRNQEIQIISDALKGDGASPDLTSIFAGARGTGKTVLLAQFRDMAVENGWIAIDLSCTDDLLEEALGQLRVNVAEVLDLEKKKQLTSVQLGSIGFTWENEKSDSTATWRMIVDEILKQLTQKDIGVLFTVDEVKANVKEMIYFMSSYQKFVTNGRKVGVLMAGLPYHVSKLLEDKDISFTRRAQYKTLERIPDGDASIAFETTVKSSERTIGEEALRVAVEEADGFPYMIQLVGYRMLEQNPFCEEVGVGDVRSGAKQARKNMEDAIYRTTWKELSPGDKKFVLVMLKDEGSSSISDISKRLSKTKQYVFQYKKRLLAAGVIRETERGFVTIGMPGLKEFLKKEYEN